LLPGSGVYLHTLPVANDIWYQVHPDNFAVMVIVVQAVPPHIILL
jgi:hypothetical protein